MDYETAILNVENIENVRIIRAHRINILNLSDIDKYINLESLTIIGCTMTYDNLLNYDYSKFLMLTELILLENSTVKKYLNIDDLKKMLCEEVFLNNIDCAYETAVNLINNTSLISIFSFIYKYFDLISKNNGLEEIFKKTNLSKIISYSEFINKFSDINKIYFNYEKDTYEENYQTESKIPLNKNIYKLSVCSLTLSYYYLNEFFNLLPVDSPLIKKLSILNFSYDTEFKNQTSDFKEFMYGKNEEHKIIPKYKNGNILFDNDPICKIILFDDLGDDIENNVFKYLASDMYNLFKNPKNEWISRKKKMNSLTDIHDLIMYLDEKCVYYNFSNSFVDFKSNIKIMCINIIRCQEFKCYHVDGEQLHCVKKLPTELEYLYMNFRNEYHDFSNSYYDDNNYLIDDNLPSTLKEIQLSGQISQTMKNQIIRIPHSCKLVYE